MVQIWCDGEQLETRNFSNPPKVGDMIEIERDGEIHPYEVVKLYSYFSVKGTASARMDVSFRGPPHFVYG